MFLQIKKYCFFFALSLGSLFFPYSTQAAVTTDFDGCFYYNATAANPAIHMLDLICTIQITNDATPVTWDVPVANLDPHYYHVLKNGNRLETVTYNQSAMQISLPLEAYETAEIVIRPWEDLDQRDQVTIFAGGDPQNQTDTVPNPVFVNFMSYAATINQLLFVIAGDVIRGDSSDADVHEYEYQETIELIQKTPVTVVTTVGDHDSRQDYTEYFSKYLGQIPRVVSYNKNIDFFLINSTETLETEGEIAPSTMTWLEEALAASTATYKVVVLHHPLDVPDGATSMGVASSDKLALAELLADYNVQVAFVGDAHWYDVDTINGETAGFEGLNGELLQLVMGGLGGKIDNYRVVHPDTADHFMMMITFGAPNDDDGIAYTRLTQTDLDIEKKDLSKNNGTEKSINVQVTNNGSVAIPQMRVKFFGSAPNDNTYYAFSSDGQVYKTISHQFGDTKRGYVELENIPAQKTLDLTIAAVQTPYLDVINTYKKDGTITFSEKPQSTTQATDLLVRSAEASGEITVSAWDVEENMRKWQEAAKTKNAKTKYTVMKLEPYRSYAIMVNDTMVETKVADADGNIQFYYSGAKQRDFEVIPQSRKTTAQVGVLPADEKKSQFRLYTKSGKKKKSFRLFPKKVTGGFESQWIQADSDTALEILAVGGKKYLNRLRLVEKNGKILTSLYPFGTSFTGDIVSARVDAAGSGKEMILVAQGSGGSAVKGYTYSAKKKKLIHQFTLYPFGENFRKGIAITPLDVDGDGSDEFAVADRSANSSVILYDVTSENSVKRLDSIESTHGSDVVIAAGDVNHNGNDELLVGSASSLTALSYGKNSQNLTVIKKLTTTQEIADLFVSNIDTTKREEIIFTSSQGELFIYNYTSKEKWKKRAQKNPFPENTNHALDVGFSYVATAKRHYIHVASTSKNGQVILYKKTKKKLQPIKKYFPYGTDFQSGIHFTAL